MDLSLNEMQQMLKNQARDFLKRELPWEKVKEIDESETGFSPELWRKTAELGWVGMLLPENYGGMGLGIVDMAVICEEMGYMNLPGPYFSSAILCSSLILEAGTDEQKKQLLPAMAQGEKIVTLALTEPDYGWTPQCIHLKAEPKNGGYVLNGVKRFVHDAQIADHLICVARTKESSNPAEGITLFLVDKDASGLSSRMLSGYSGEKLSEVKFDSVEVPAASIIGEKDNGWAALGKPWDTTALLLSAYGVGGSQHLMEMTLEYSQIRVQFGRPIGAFQWVQGYVIEQANLLEKARWITNEALWMVEVNKPQQEQKQAIAMAKAVASDALRECGHVAHEVHAGVGIDLNYRLYLYAEKSKVLYFYLGDPHLHLRRVADIMFEGV